MTQQPSYTYITGPLTKKSAFGLLAILSLGALLRLLLAYFQPAYIDEAFNYYISKPGWQHMLHALQPDNHTPAVQLMVYPLLAFSDAIFVLRLPLVLCGVLSLALSFKLLRRFHTENFSLGLCLFFP